MDLKKFRLLVTPTSYAKNDPRLKTELERQFGEVIYNPTGKPLTSEEVASLLPGIDGYIAGLDCIDSRALQHADKLKVIARYGVGVDAVDLEVAKKMGIVVTNTPGANSASVAELAVALILTLARQLSPAFSATRAGQWPRLSGITLENKYVALIGLGAIGKQTALRLKGFGCHLMAYDPYPDQKFAAEHQIDLDEMNVILEKADFVSLHLPLMPQTKNLVNRQFLSQMKRGAYLINTARGELVDEDALLEALKSGHLAGAALDALIQEPPDPNSELLSFPGVISTPHLGAQTDGAVNQMGWMAYEDCLAVLQGKPPLHPVQ
ncbi:MAG: phosphoglycerate dehydrogenase [Leptolinea sp.]|jgi:phosphoglycerate dehydrogenase-like enzyme|nr:phosphoglycerate dehydrogenase [Leptolinea sp.]